jgi:hypothetical protein
MLERDGSIAMQMLRDDLLKQLPDMAEGEIVNLLPINLK